MRKDVYQIEKQVNKILFRLAVLVTILAMGMILAEFLSRGAFPPTKIGFFYIGVLLMYSLHKEALRWMGGKELQIGGRRGEYFVYAWILLTSALYLINFLTKDYFIIDNQGSDLTALPEITFITLEACAVFIFARVVKVIFNVLYFGRRSK
jgi:hypothetical protein